MLTLATPADHTASQLPSPFLPSQMSEIPLTPGQRATLKYCSNYRRYWPASEFQRNFDPYCRSSNTVCHACSYPSDEYAMQYHTNRDGVPVGPLRHTQRYIAARNAQGNALPRFTHSQPVGPVPSQSMLPPLQSGQHIMTPYQPHIHPLTPHARFERAQAKLPPRFTPPHQWAISLPPPFSIGGIGF